MSGNQSSPFQASARIRAPQGREAKSRSPDLPPVAEHTTPMVDMTQDQEFNKKKARRYAFALERTSKALDSGFYLEAITLCESMIADRLLSSLARREQRIVRRNKGLGWLIAEHINGESLQKSATSKGKTEADVFLALDRWREERNELLHGIAKCAPGDQLSNPPALMARAKGAAEEGIRLFRLLDNWHAKHTRGCSRPGQADDAA